jgi:hypothetical protein
MATGTAPPSPSNPAPRGPGKSSATEVVAYDRFIEGQLTKTRRQVKGIDLASSLITLSAGAILYLLAAIVVDQWLVTGGLGFWGRLLCLGGFIAALIAYCVMSLIPLILHRINPVYAAFQIEQSTPSLKNSLVNFLLLRNQTTAMPSVVWNAIEEKAATDLSKVQADTVIDSSRLIKLGWLLLAVMIVAAGYKAFSPKDPIPSIRRVLSPWSSVAAPTRSRIEEIQPGKTQGYFGKSIEVSAVIHGIKSDEPVTLFYSTADGQVVNQTISMAVPEGSYRHTARLPAGPSGLQEDVVYWIVAGDATSPRFDVQVVSAPTIEVESVDYVYPAYTELEPRSTPRQGEILAIEGTKVTISAQANNDIRSAWVDFDCDGHRSLLMAASGRKASTTFALNLKPHPIVPNRSSDVPEHDKYQLGFDNLKGAVNEQPIRYRIQVTPDLPPEIRFTQPDVAPEQEQNLAEGATMLLVLEASDPDFQLAQITLIAERKGTRIFQDKLLAESRKGRVRPQFVLDSKRYALKNGDEIVYWAEAKDNKDPNPNVTETPRYKLRISSPPAEKKPQDQLAQNNPPDQQPKNQPPKDQQKNPNDRQQDPQDKNQQDKQDKQDKQPGQQDRREGDPKQGEQNKPGEHGKPEDKQQGDQKPGDNKPGQKDPADKQPGDQQNKDPQNKDKQEGDQKPGQQDKPGDNAKQDNGKQGDKQQGDQKQGDNKPNDGKPNDGKPNDGKPNDGKPNDGKPGEGQEEGGQKGNGQKNGGQQGGDQKQGDPAEGGQGEKNGGQKGAERQRGVDPADPGKAIDEINKHIQEKQKEEQQRNGGSQKADGQGDKQDQGQQKQPQGAKDPADAKNAGGQPKADQGQKPDQGNKPGQQGEKSGQQGEKSGQQGEKSGQPGDKSGKQGEKAGQQGEKGDKPGQQGEKAGQQGDKPGQQGDKPGQKPGQGEKPEDGKNNPLGQRLGEGGEKADPQAKDPGKDQPKEGDGGQAKGEGKDDKQPMGGGKQDAKQQGGDPQGKDKGDAGAGSKGSEKNASPAPEENNKQREKTPSPADGGKPDDKDAPESPGNSKNQSDSKGGQAGDQSGGGKKGGGQRSDSPGTGSAGQNTASDQGGGQAAQKGDGETSKEGGDKKPAGKPTDNAKSQGEGPGSKSKAGDKQQGGEPGKKPDGQQTPGKPSDQQSNNEGGGTSTGNPQGGGPSNNTTNPQRQNVPEPGGEDPNLEYTRKATDLAVENLKDQLAKNKLDQELLDKLKWSREDVEKFVKHWEEMKREAGQPGAKGKAAREQLDESLRSLGLRPRGTNVKGNSTADKFRNLKDARDSQPPAEYADQYRAYSTGTSKAKNK